MSTGSTTTGLKREAKRMHKRQFRDEMNLMVPRAQLDALIAPYVQTRNAKGDLPPFVVESMLRIHFHQQSLYLSEPAVEDAPYRTAFFREFAGLDMGEGWPSS